ncbi:SnoaL-like protein [Stackebrandtia albiflava]|uniref:SnoaL-like protein n=1 Tax=Stackebrandtia albiflava TaxID=406432 RepID=A0A562UYZ0_9ACTN|nr:nuclear transport factor 2 family protein [Stackebrandtia albiflava]TWJ10826.1 SnoaL-like protein [Stackebrandtia albiflava]
MTDVLMRELADRVEISELISRFYREVEAANGHPERLGPDWERSYFTPDVRVEYPFAVLEGIELVGRSLRDATGMFAAVHVLTTDHEIRIDGDRAFARWNTYNTHVHHPGFAAEHGELFVVGDRFTGDLVRTADGWRFATQTLEVIWSRGTPPPPPIPE